MTDENQTKVDESQIKVNKNDSLVNAATSMGVANRARNPATTWESPKVLSDEDLVSIYSGDGFGKLVIDIFATDMTREWITVTNDPDGLINKYLIKQLKAKKSFANLIRWSRLYGGALLLMGIDDGGDLEDPLNESAMNTIEFLRVIDKSQITIQSTVDWYNDPENPKFGNPKLYTITPVNAGGGAVPQYKVHESRVIRMDGEVAPDSRRAKQEGWGDSSLIAVYNYLRNLATVYEISSEILHDFVISVISIKDLSKILSRPKGQEDLMKRAEVISYVKSVINGMILDTEENFEKLTTNVTGISDLINSFSQALSSVTRIPETILMGKSPSGLNANSDNDIRAWYDALAAEQEDTLKPGIERLISLILLSADSPYPKKTIDDFDVEFKPLWQYDEPTQVDMRLKQAQADNLYIENGTLEPEQVEKSRFENGYSFETTVTPAGENG